MACTPRPMSAAFFALFFVLLPTRLLALDPPLAAYWHPKDLRGWTPDRDPSFAFNQDRTPLQPRVPTPAQPRLLPLFPQQTSGHPTTLHQKTFAHILEYWANTDTVVYFGGSASEGLILAPPPGWIRAAHRNGSRILGSIFFPPNTYGGQAVWVDEFLNEQTLDGLIAVARAYGFDGYFVNQETAAGSVPQVGSRMVAALQKLRAAGLEISWYDAMLMSGNVSWQRNLNSNNKPFFDASSSIFLDFGGSSYKASATLAQDRARAVYQGINVFNSYSASQMKAMVEAGLSVGTYATESIATDAQQKSFYLDTVNPLMPPRALDLGDTFSTRFNTGRGLAYFVRGQKQALWMGSGEWRDLRQQSYLPDQTPAAGVTQSYDTAMAFEGGTSLMIQNDRATRTPLFRHQIAVNDSHLTLAYASAEALQLEISGTETRVFDLPASKTWTTQTFAIDFSGRVNGLHLILPTPGVVRLGALSIASDRAPTRADIRVERQQNQVIVQDHPARLYSEVWAKDAKGQDVLVEWIGSSLGFIADAALQSAGLRVRHLCQAGVECPDTVLP